MLFTDFLYLCVRFMFIDGMLDFIHKYETKIEFSKIGHDLSLDFVKGVCILLVILNHSTGLTFHQDSWFFLWGYPAVPLFLLIQVYHSYKKEFDGIHINWLRIWRRAFSQFLFVQTLLFTYVVISQPTRSLHSIFMAAFYWGGRGPGSYYPWIYIQFAILLPCLRPLFRSIGDKTLLILFLGLSIGSELLCHYTHMSDWVYRLLFLRYIFLIFLGYQMVVRGIVLNMVTVSLSVISLIAVYCFVILKVNWTPFFFNSNEWPTCHWICYFYIAYPLFFLLCKFFYWLPPNSVIENAFCKMGRHSYAIFIFQLFYFFVFGPLVADGLSFIEDPVVEKVFFLFISIIACVIPVLQFVDGLSRGTILLRVGAILMIIVCVITFVRWKWRPFYMPSRSFNPYPVTQYEDDTLRVIMIGDSWVYFHETLRRDSTFENELKRVMKSRKVKVTAKGKAGATSGEIYQRMSAEQTMEMDFDLNYCSQSVIEEGADYCVISAGINDARQRRGKYYYVSSYLQIIRLLLSQGIRPVIMEIPNVYVDEAFTGNTLYYRLKARICMSVLNTGLYGVGDYRNILKDSLFSTHLMDSVIYISAASWNPDGWKDKRDIYTDDHFHLNLAGYELLDSTFAVEIVKDYKIRKKLVN